jgi:hypothetical protein
VLGQTVDLLNVEHDMPFRGDRVKAANRLPLQQPVECGLHVANSSLLQALEMKKSSEEIEARLKMKLRTG